jgi:hypothetical protein
MHSYPEAEPITIRTDEAPGSEINIAHAPILSSWYAFFHSWRLRKGYGGSTILGYFTKLQCINGLEDYDIYVHWCKCATK